jgi:two-component system LytT family response regulator
MREIDVSNLLVVAPAATARAELVLRCAALTHVRVIGEYSSGGLALEAADALRPDLLLLDTPLTDMTARDLLCQLPERCRHAVVFITANEQDITPSLETGAAECLTRPFTTTALATALVRAKARAQTTLRETTKLGWASTFTPLPSATDTAAPIVLVGEREHRLYPLDPHRVDYIEAAHNYVTFHMGSLEYIARDTVKRLDLILRPLGFTRIERSLLLNIRAIRYVQPVGHGMFVFALASGKRLRSSPAYRESILDTLPLRRRTSARPARRSHRVVGAIASLPLPGNRRAD